VSFVPATRNNIDDAPSNELRFGRRSLADLACRPISSIGREGKIPALPSSRVANSLAAEKISELSDSENTALMIPLTFVTWSLGNLGFCLKTGDRNRLSKNRSEIVE
jgi:hypothetical protein